MQFHKSITQDRIVDMLERDELEGICVACGEDAYGVDPDSRSQECEACGARKVYGAQELLLHCVA